MGGLCGSTKNNINSNKIEKKVINADNVDEQIKHIEKIEKELNEKMDKNLNKLGNNNEIKKQINESSSNNNKNNFLEKFRNDCLDRHNFHRKNHGVDDLKFNSELNEIAQNYAKKLADTNTFEHSGATFNGDNIGENIFMQSGRAMLGGMPADSWYDEIKDYNFKNPQQKTGVVGHFTQLVWKGSKEIGIGCAQASDGSYYVVSNYYPAGNWVGEEMENVLEKN